MNSEDDSSVTDKGVTQAQVYDNLKRIGELEDQKKSIQEEIQNRTEQLRDVIVHIDKGSILHKMLEAALKDFRPTPGSAGGGKRATKGAANASSQGSKKKSRRN